MKTKDSINKLKYRVHFISAMKGVSYLEQLVKTHLDDFHVLWGKAYFGKDHSRRNSIEANYLYWKVSRDYINLKREMRNQYGER